MGDNEMDLAEQPYNMAYEIVQLERQCADLERLVWALRRGWIIRDVHLNGMNIRPTLRTPHGGPWTQSSGYPILGFLCDYDSTGTILLSAEARAALEEEHDGPKDAT